MKRLCWLLAFATPLAASASFELVLVADPPTDSVHRFDGISGTYLGAVGAGLLVGMRSMAIHQASNSMYVLEDDGLTLSCWNYNTGAYKWTKSLPAVIHSIGTRPDGTLYLVRPDRVDNVTLNLNFLRTWTPSPDFGFVSADWDPMNGTLIGEYHVSGSHFRRRWGYDDGTLNSYYWEASGVGYGTSAASSGDYLISTFDSAYVALVRLTDSQWAHKSGVVFATQDCAMGHGAMAYFAGRSVANTSQGLIARYDAQSFSYRGSFGNLYLRGPIGMAVVVAPEPGTIAVFGLAAIALLRRCRNCS